MNTEKLLTVVQNALEEKKRKILKFLMSINLAVLPILWLSPPVERHDKLSHWLNM